MKRILSMFLVLTLSLSLGFTAWAEEPEQVEMDITEEISEQTAVNIIIEDLDETEETEPPVNEVSAGITPGSMLYFFDRLIENVQLALASTPEAKAALLTTIAQERLAEIEALDPAKLNNYIDSLLADVNSALEQAAEALSKAKDSGVEIKDLLELLKDAATIGSNVTLPEAIQRTPELEETQTKLRDTKNSIKVQAAVVRNIEEEIVLELRSQGLGYGQIALLVKLAEATQDNEVSETTALEQVITIFAQTKSVGQTMKAFDLNPGQAKKIAVEKKETREVQASEGQDNRETGKDKAPGQLKKK